MMMPPPDPSPGKAEGGPEMRMRKRYRENSSGTSTGAEGSYSPSSPTGEIPEKLFCVNVSEDYLVESPKFPLSFLSRLNELRVNEEFCDLVLTADGRRFPVHKAVMVAFSDYFRAMMRADMLEREQMEVCLRGVSSNGLQAMINFAYTGQLTLNLEDIEEILSAAAHLQVQDALELCTTFLETFVTTNSCLDILNMAETYFLESVIAVVKAYMLKNFETFADTEYFIHLKQSQLSPLLGDNRLRVQSEYRLFQLLCRWIEENPVRLDNVETLVEHIRLPLMSGEELVEKVSRVTFMKENRQCSDLLTEAKDYHIVIAKQPLMQSPRTQVRSELPSICRFHVENLDSYNLVTKRHVYLRDCVIPMYNPCVCVVDNFLYACGGRYDCNENSEIASARCFRYDSRFDVWFELNPMNEARKDFVLVGIGQQLFAFGGQDENMVMCTVERFPVAVNDWDFRTSMRNALYGHAGAACGGLVYITGGQRFDGFSNAVTAYDPETNTWDEKKPMLMNRGNHVMEEVKGKLYVLGGNWEDVHGLPVTVPLVEMYDPVSNQWSALKTTLHIREAGSCVHEDKIFIVGGVDDTHYYSHALQEYDTETDSCRIVERSPTRIYGRVCCLLVLPQCA